MIGATPWEPRPNFGGDMRKPSPGDLEAVFLETREVEHLLENSAMPRSYRERLAQKKEELLLKLRD